MYEQFFGLTEKPFSILPDSSCLYMSEGHAKALTLLQYSIVGRQAFTVITGEIGSGKTTLINRLLDDIEDDVTVGLLNFTDPGALDLNEWVAMAFGLDYRGKSQVELYEEFTAFLIRQYAQRKYTVLIVDEAQNLAIRGLERIRMLSNVNAQKEHLLHLVLVGQPELRDLLNAPELRQLMQRVSVFYHLDRLSPDETKAYIGYRLENAGASSSIFSPAAIKLIMSESQGVPRVINSICDLCLVYAFSAQKHKIDVRVVRSVIEDRIGMGLVEGSLQQNTGVGVG